MNKGIRTSVLPFKAFLMFHVKETMSNLQYNNRIICETNIFGLNINPYSNTELCLFLALNGCEAAVQPDVAEEGAEKNQAQQTMRTSWLI